MYFAEQPTNTAARASNGAERSRWRDEGVDPELTADPYDTLQASRRPVTTHETAELPVQRPLSADVAAMVIQRASAQRER